MSVKRNFSIDLFKFIFALCVIAIHTALFSDVNDTLYFYVIGILCRLAVPCFAICTGYFLGKKTNNNAKTTGYWTSFFQQWKKLIKMYIVWTIIYLIWSIPMWIEIDWFSLWSFVDYAIGAVTKGAHYHLWYVLSTIYAIPVMYILVKKLSPQKCAVVAIVLYVVKTIAYGYRMFLTNFINEIFVITDKVPRLFDAVFCILPFMLIGYNLAFIKEENKRISLYMFFLCLVLWMVEANWLKIMGVSSYSYLIFTFPTAYCLFDSIKNMGIKNINIAKYKLNELSLYIYCIHPIFIEMLDGIKISTVMNFIIISILSILFGLLLIQIKERIILKTGNNYV